MKGPAPKDPTERLRKNKEQRFTIEGEPSDPPKLPNAQNYSQVTLDWWQTWVDSPQATLFISTDWQRLVFLAPLVEQFWTDTNLSSNQRTGLLAEIRLNEERVGATVRDRQSLRWDIESPKQHPLEKMEKDTKEDRRKRLLNSVELN